MLLIISPGTGMYTTLCPTRRAEQNTEQSPYYDVCGALVCGTSGPHAALEHENQGLDDGTGEG